MSLARLITSIHNVLNLSLLVPHALKGQKLLAQGSALGIMAVSKAPCKGNSLINCLEFLKLLPLQVGCSKSINFSTRFLRRNTS